MTHLWLIRHADYIYDLVDGNYPKRDQGLSPDGVVQAQKLRDRLASTGEIKPDIFISSTERGAHETAQIIAPVSGLPITLDRDVEEWRSEDGSLSTEEFMGTWNSLSDEQKPYHRFVDGCETMMEFSLRVYLALNRILEEQEEKTILILTHGAFIQVAFSYFFALSTAIPQRTSPEIRRTSITHFYKPPNRTRWILERLNDCYHLL